MMIIIIAIIRIIMMMIIIIIIIIIIMTIMIKMASESTFLIKPYAFFSFVEGHITSFTYECKKEIMLFCS